MGLLTLLTDWLANRRETRVILQQAHRVVNASESSEAAKLWAASTIEALKERRYVCSICFNPFEYKARPWEQYFTLRSVLMIPDGVPNPMVCDSCFESAVMSFNRHATNVGTRNEGAPNLVLKTFG
jgi:hypothetical protein